MPVAHVLLGESRLTIPALKNTTLIFSDHPDYDRVSRHVSAELEKPWGDESLRFCDTNLKGPQDVNTVQFHHAAVLPLLADIGYTQESGPTMVLLTKPPIHPAAIAVVEGAADVFVLDPAVNTLGWPDTSERLRTSGWINGTHAVFTSCIATSSDGAKFICGYRILRRKDAVEIEFIGVSVSEKPTLNQKNPEILFDLIAKFDATLAHYALTETFSE